MGIWQILILFEWRFGRISSVNFQVLMMKTLRYKYCKKRITTRKIMSIVMSQVVIRLLYYLYLHFSSLKLKNGLKKHFRNVIKIKHGFVKLVVIFCTFYKMWLCDPSPNMLGVGNVYGTENWNLIKQKFRMSISRTDRQKYKMVNW